MLTKFLVSAAIVFGAAVSVAAPALADPSPFGGVGCADPMTCQQSRLVGSQVPNPEQMPQGIQQGLAALQGQQ